MRATAKDCVTLYQLCVIDTLQAIYKPSGAPFWPTDGSILVPSALTADYNLGNNSTCSHGVLHLSSIEMVPLASLHPTCTSSQDGPAPSVTASTSTPNGAAASYLCSQADSHQLMSEPGHDSTDTLVQTAAASAVDTLVDDLLEDVLSFHNSSTAYAVDAVVEQLVSEAICDAQTADYAMKQSQEPAKAVDSVLDSLVTDVVSNDAAAQVEVVDAVLDELISNAVGDVQAALVESLSDLKTQTTAVDTVFERVISSVVAEAVAESAAACQPFTAQSLVSEQTGNVSEAVGSVSERPSMHSPSGADQAVCSACYSPPQAAENSGVAVKQQVQQLRRDMEVLSKVIQLEVYQVPPLFHHQPRFWFKAVYVCCTPSLQFLLHTIMVGLPGPRSGKVVAEYDCLWWCRRGGWMVK